MQSGGGHRLGHAKLDEESGVRTTGKRLVIQITLQNLSFAARSFAAASRGPLGLAAIAPTALVRQHALHVRAFDGRDGIADVAERGHIAGWGSVGALLTRTLVFERCVALNECSCRQDLTADPRHDTPSHWSKSGARTPAASHAHHPRSLLLCQADRSVVMRSPCAGAALDPPVMDSA
jgi:hypothetical protein